METLPKIDLGSPLEGGAHGPLLLAARPAPSATPTVPALVPSVPDLLLAARAVLEGIVGLVHPLTGARRTSLLIADEDGRIWLAASAGVPLTACQPVTVSQGIAAEVMRTGQPMLTEDLSRLPFPAHPERGYATHSCMAAPVIQDGAIYGVFCAADPCSGDSFTAGDLAKLHVLADHVGACLQALVSARSLADTDGLTGVQNRRAFEQRLFVEVERCRRFGGPLSLLVVDVDNLRRVNEIDGRREGDRVLVHVARALVDTVRRVDVVARYGSDDFTVLLPQTGVAESLKVAERLAQNLPQHLPGNDGGPTVSFRASIGAASLPPALTPEELLDRAAQALRQAKGSRERLRHWDPVVGTAEVQHRQCRCAHCGTVFVVDAGGRPQSRRYCSKGCTAAARRLVKGERNATILALRAEGLTLQTIAGRFGISIERVRQICSSR